MAVNEALRINMTGLHNESCEMHSDAGSNTAATGSTDTAPESLIACFECNLKNSETVLQLHYLSKSGNSSRDRSLQFPVGYW